VCRSLKTFYLLTYDGKTGHGLGPKGHMCTVTNAVLDLGWGHVVPASPLLDFISISTAA
jgi:hypothetical protein